MRRQEADDASLQLMFLSTCQPGAAEMSGHMSQNTVLSLAVGQRLLGPLRRSKG